MTRSKGKRPVAASVWNPAQYERFRAERSQPFYDLLALVRPEPAMAVIDLGCGTGELTRVLHERLRAASTVGLDSSETMLAKSAAFAGDGLRFERGDIAAFAAEGRYDLIFSNAALQWVPEHVPLLASRPSCGRRSTRSCSTASATASSTCACRSTRTTWPRVRTWWSGRAAPC
jgi:SAM-dependent methyltransferase